MEKITVNGVDYAYDIRHNGDIVDLYNSEGDLIGQAEFDHAAEQIFAEHRDPETGESEPVEVSFFEFVEKDRAELAGYLLGIL